MTERAEDWQSRREHLESREHRVLVCGSRSFPTPSYLIRGVLRGLLKDVIGKVIIIEGACPTGADAAARECARDEGWSLVSMPADWERYGKAAGPRRNQDMIDLDPALVIAFVDKPLKDSRGTADTIRRAEQANLSTVVCRLSRRNQLSEEGAPKK